MPLGEIVLAYVDHLGEAGDLDLEAVTEFLVLIAALCELKSRLLLPHEEGTDELGPQEAADELLARMLEYRRLARRRTCFTSASSAKPASCTGRFAARGAPQGGAEGGHQGLRARPDRSGAR